MKTLLNQLPLNLVQELAELVNPEPNILEVRHLDRLGCQYIITEALDQKLSEHEEKAFVKHYQNFLIGGIYNSLKELLTEE